MIRKDFTRYAAFFTASVVTMTGIFTGCSTAVPNTADPNPIAHEIVLRTQDEFLKSSAPAASGLYATTVSAETIPVSLPPAVTEPSPEPEYDYSIPVAESDAVDDSYFDTAVFIGDSRTDGLRLWGGQKNMRALFGTGLNVKTVFSALVADGETKTVIDALKDMDFSSVYICLGINELGWDDPLEYKECYRNIVKALRQINPDATVYIEEIIPVTYTRTVSDGTYNNDRIAVFNGLLRELAVEEKAYFITVGESVADENGCLPEEGSTDGVHMYPSYYEKWINYIKTHTIGD